MAALAAMKGALKALCYFRSQTIKIAQVHIEQGSSVWSPLVLTATSTYLSDMNTCWPLLMHRRQRGVLCAFVSMSRRQHWHVPPLSQPHSVLCIHAPSGAA